MDSEEVRRAKELEVAAIWSAEEGRFEVAVELLSEAVAIAHDYPSLYNNRAQVTMQMYRWMCMHNFTDSSGLSS